MTGLTAGDEVWGFVNAVRNPGPPVGAAEYVLAPVGGTALRPRTVSAVEAAAVSVVGASALGILRDVVHLQGGERVLIRGANGGVGTAAVQIARAMGGQVTALAIWTGCATWVLSRTIQTVNGGACVTAAPRSPTQSVEKRSEPHRFRVI